MAIYLTEADVEKLLDMSTAVRAVEEAFRLLGEEKAQNQPRRRVMAGESVLHFMAGGTADLGTLGRGATAVKVYTTSKRGVRFTVLLYDDDGTPLAVIQAGRLGQFRTGAASGVATRYLARVAVVVVAGGIFQDVSGTFVKLIEGQRVLVGLEAELGSEILVVAGDGGDARLADGPHDLTQSQGVGGRDRAFGGSRALTTSEP